MIAKRNAVLWADIEVVSRLILRCPEHLSIFDSEIAAIFVAQPPELRHHYGHVAYAMESQHPSR